MTMELQADLNLSDAARSGLARVLDVLLPGTDTLPSGRSMAAQDELLDRVLTADPRLQPVVRRVGGLAAAAETCTLADVETWAGAETEQLVFALHAAYYLSKDVRRALGYPGQERRPITLATSEEVCSDQLIAPVIDRGPIYVPTP
jgi:hypothetical protein